MRQLLLVTVLWAGTASAQTFRDVSPDHWAAPFINALAASGVTAGCGNEKYCPAQPVTRAQMAVFLERGMNGSDYVPPAASGQYFLDVGAGDFAANFIEQLFIDGITSGCGGGNYCPSATVSRDQMAVFLLRVKYGSSYSPPPATGVFADVPSNYWAASWIEQLAAEGTTAGCGGGNYCPEGEVSRAQMAVFLVRTFGLPPAPPDSEPPTVPADVAVTAISNTEISLNWTASTDDRYVAGYTIYRDGVFHSEVVSGVEFIDQGLSTSTQYCYQVFAFDASGNTSAAATEQCGTTNDAPPVSFTFNRLADSSTVIPGASQSIGMIFEAKLTESGVVFNAGDGSMSRATMFRIDGSGTSVIADSSQIDRVVSLSVDANTAYFLGAGLKTIYRESGNGLEVFIDDQTVVSGTNSPWPFFVGVDAKGNNVVFRASYLDGAIDIYVTSGGVYNLVADMAGLSPGDTGSFERLSDSEVVTSDGKVAFTAHQEDGGTLRQGVYEFSGGLVSLVATYNTIWPGSTEELAAFFDWLSYDGAEMVFRVQRFLSGEPREYIFRHQAATSEFELLLSDSDNVTGDDNSVGLLTLKSPISRGNRIAFFSDEINNAPGYYRGVKLKKNGAVYRVLTGDDMLDGKQVWEVYLKDFDGQDMLLLVEFYDDSQALYRVTISE